MMQNLFEALKTEEAGDYDEAIKIYKEMTEGMDPLGKIWTFQAIARCYEKLGNVKEAINWNEKAIQAYPSIPARVMGYRETVFYALVEARHNLEKSRNDPETFKRIFQLYTFILDKCLNRYLFPPSSLGHEVLSAATICEKLGMEEKAADYYFWCGELYRELVKEEPTIANEIMFMGKKCCELAEKIYTKLGMTEKAQKAHKRIDTIRIE